PRASARQRARPDRHLLMLTVAASVIPDPPSTSSLPWFCQSAHGISPEELMKASLSLKDGRFFHVNLAVV
ncbi:MAG TPA: hypothetical protein PL012_07345, partial [Candidatus Obscuribacter sp.]|nr:hypothetical protein [Candidatus Obscuribacter sp.]